MPMMVDDWADEDSRGGQWKLGPTPLQSTRKLGGEGGPDPSTKEKGEENEGNSDDDDLSWMSFEGNNFGSSKHEGGEEKAAAKLRVEGIEKNEQYSNAVHVATPPRVCPSCRRIGCDLQQPRPGCRKIARELKGRGGPGSPGSPNVQHLRKYSLFGSEDPLKARSFSQGGVPLKPGGL
jgi:hypothetical protein